MHDQYVTRRCAGHVRHRYEQQHREFCQAQKRPLMLCWRRQSGSWTGRTSTPSRRPTLWQQADERQFRGALSDLRTFQRLRNGLWGSPLGALSSLRNILPSFCIYRLLPEQGNASLLDAIAMIRQLDAGTLKRLPPTVPTGFVPQNSNGHSRIRRADQPNAWGTAWPRHEGCPPSGDLYLPQSKQHVSFGSYAQYPRWQEVQPVRLCHTPAPPKPEAKASHPPVPCRCDEAKAQFPADDFATIQDGN